MAWSVKAGEATINEMEVIISAKVDFWVQGTIQTSLLTFPTVCSKGCTINMANWRCIMVTLKLIVINFN